MWSNTSPSYLNRCRYCGSESRQSPSPEFKIGDPFLIFRLISSNAYLLYTVCRTLSYNIHYQSSRSGGHQLNCRNCGDAQFSGALSQKFLVCSKKCHTLLECQLQEPLMYEHRSHKWSSLGDPKKSRRAGQSQVIAVTTRCPLIPIQLSRTGLSSHD